jgi:hypothetical protein
MDTPATAHVEHFRQVLLWPLRLMPQPNSGAGHRQPWQVLTDLGDASPWRAVADAPWTTKLLIFSTVFVLTLALTVFTMAKSKRLSDFLDAISDERLTVWQKFRSLGLVWRKHHD